MWNMVKQSGMGFQDGKIVYNIMIEISIIRIFVYFLFTDRGFAERISNRLQTLLRK